MDVWYTSSEAAMTVETRFISTTATEDTEHVCNHNLFIH